MKKKTSEWELSQVLLKGPRRTELQKEKNKIGK